ncbi:glycosyltransferase [Sphingomonas daechungensis]|uniref:Glycosyltransferase n=1 Tax=Sphingomonas daechungensis TaxID=1176646 RepID=A0ABX6T2I0_9SPHN|nr:glycosyltransferase [Sphingomonas daechungensis]QNP43107.1 glycosyltransferase [Sphingomonas daechungensis]
MTNEPPSPTVAYVMTHYPRVALSFLSGEIDEMELRGATIAPFAMNLPDQADLLSEDARTRYAKTHYLKRSWGDLLGAFSSAALRHPLAMAKLIGTAVKSARGDLPLTARRFSHLLQGAAVARECQRRNIHHLHAQFGQAPATIAWFAAEIMNFGERRANWSFTIHGFQDFVDETIARLDLKAASASFVVCVSDFTRSQLYRLLHPSLWNRARVVRCGIDLSRFRQRPARPQSAVPRLISVGRLSTEKGQVVLLRACKLLADRSTKVHLTLIGSGPLEGLIRSEIANEGMADYVELTGELPPGQVRERLEASDVFCLTSFAEGLPISIMEAMAVGVPVVASSIAGIPELVVNGETGLTVPAGNVEALADAIEKLLSAPNLRDSIIAAARKRVEQQHERHRNCDAMFELLTNRAEVVA